MYSIWTPAAESSRPPSAAGDEEEKKEEEEGEASNEPKMDNGKTRWII
jgi:hypothetical protein